jgi:5,8-dihydroxy-2-naphthoate synthase
MADSVHPLKNQKLTLGFSPCPNDTFIFDALVHRKIDTEGLVFEPEIEEVESLNRKAMLGKLTISKISFAACFSALEQYQVLNSGGALGNGVGPLLVSKGDPGTFLSCGGRGLSVAIPGKHTTAHFLFRVFFPDAAIRREMVFSDIEDAVLSGEVDAGVIIHEGRFTYEKKGLRKICDLGALWEAETNLPIPLGCIAIKRNLPEETKQAVDRVIRRSVAFALEHPAASTGFVKRHAQEMEEEVRRKHIALYVNQHSMDLGPEGRAAVEALFKKAIKAGIAADMPKDIFVPQAVYPGHAF